MHCKSVRILQAIALHIVKAIATYCIASFVIAIYCGYRKPSHRNFASYCKASRLLQAIARHCGYCNLFQAIASYCQLLHAITCYRNPLRLLKAIVYYCKPLLLYKLLLTILLRAITC